MNQGETQKVKLIMVEDKPYVVSLDKVNIGDKVIVTVGGQYPSIVDCQNETVLSLLTDSKLSLTQSFKVFMEPQFIKFTTEQIEKILENDGMMEVQFDGDKYNYSL